MILCSKFKNGLCKMFIKLQVVTKFNVTKSRLHCTRNLIVSLFFGWIEPSIISQFSFRTGNCNVGTKLMAIWDIIFWSDTFDHQLTYCVKLSIAKSFKFSLIHFYFHLSLRYLGKYFSKQIGHLSPIYFEHARPQKPICFLRVWKLQTLESVLDLKVLSLCGTYLQNKSRNLKMNIWSCCIAQNTNKILIVGQSL